MSAICIIEGCERKVHGRGFCHRHYKLLPEQREKHRLSNAIWRANHREKDQAASAKYRAAHPEKAKASEKASRAKNPEMRRRYLAEYHAENRATIAKKHAKWVAANPEIVSASQATKRARKAGADGRHTGQEIKRLFTLQRGRCACCHDPLAKYHKDHVQPLASGGSNWIENIQLLCPPCNQSKHAKDPIKFMQERGFLL